jgi:hypothetical protein
MNISYAPRRGTGTPSSFCCPVHFLLLVFFYLFYLLLNCLLPFLWWRFGFGGWLGLCCVPSVAKDNVSKPIFRLNRYRFILQRVRVGEYIHTTYTLDMNTTFTLHKQYIH